MGTSSLNDDRGVESRIRSEDTRDATEGGSGGGSEGGGPNRPVTVKLLNVVTVGTHVGGGIGTLDARENNPRGVADLEPPAPDRGV